MGREEDPRVTATATAKILIVEDDSQVAETLSAALRAAGLITEAVGTYAAARQQALTGNFDVVVLDLGLPDGHGLELARELRQSGVQTPILMLTAQAALEQRLEGFARGADDYVCKPFAAAEIVARVQALLRRAQPDRQQILRFADIHLDLLKRVARCHGTEVALSDREATLLAYFMRHVEQPLTREELAQEVWGLDADADFGVVNVYVNYLRNKLEHGDPAARLIHTVRGVGYMLSRTRPE